MLGWNHPDYTMTTSSRSLSPDLTENLHNLLLSADWEVLCMITNSTFTAGPLKQVSIWIYCSCFPIAWADIHSGCRPSKRTETSIIHAVSASADCGITTREIKWFSGPMPESAWLSVCPSSPLLSLKRSQTQMNPPERRVRDCIWTGDTETELGGGCWLIINEGPYHGCSQSCMCSSDTTAQVPEALCTIAITSQHFTAGLTLLSVCHDCAVTWKSEPAKQPGLTQLRWVTPRKWAL